MTIVPFPSKQTGDDPSLALRNAITLAKERLAAASRIATPAARQNAQDLASHLKAIREAQGLTVAEFSSVVGLGESYLAGVEAGTNTPSTQLLAVLAAHLGYRVILEPLP